MKISVIVPVYNVIEYLSRCIESILSQANQEIEVILINDGSTDGSAELCDKLAYSDKRVQVVHQENTGPGGARNTGINTAKGEYLMFVDGDDFLLPEAFANVLEVLEEDSPDVISGNYLVWTPEMGLISQSSKPSWNIWRYLVCRKLIVEQEIFFKINNLCEDVPWIVEMLEAANTNIYLPEPFYAYHMHRPKSIMNSRSAQRIIDLNTNVCELIEKYYVNNELCESLIWQSFLVINEYHSFAKADRKKIFESYQTIFPKYKLSTSRLCRLAGRCTTKSTFHSLSWILSKAKQVRRMYKYGKSSSGILSSVANGGFVM